MRWCLNRYKEMMEEQRSELFVFGCFFFKSAFLSFGGLTILTIKRTTLKDIGVDEHWFKFICHAESFSCRDMP